MIIKSSYPSTLKNDEDVLHPTSSNIPQDLILYVKMNRHIDLISIKICF